jgi:hypothetical protein
MAPSLSGPPQKDAASVHPSELQGTWAGAIWRFGQTGAIRPLRLEIDVEPDGLLVFRKLSPYWLGGGTLSWTGRLEDDSRVRATRRYGIIVDGVRKEYESTMEGKVAREQGKLIIKLLVESPPISRRNDPIFMYIKVAKE